MRASFLAQDRADLCEAVKALAQMMSKPTPSSLEDLKHLARYLRGRPSVALRLWQQQMAKELLVSVDSLLLSPTLSSSMMHSSLSSSSGSCFLYRLEAVSVVTTSMRYSYVLSSPLPFSARMTF